MCNIIIIIIIIGHVERRGKDGIKEKVRERESVLFCFVNSLVVIFL